MSNSKRLPINSLGIKIKEARQKLGLSEEELSWQINDKSIDKKKIKNWEKGQEFPNLDEMYKLASNLDLNPNELLAIRNQIQDESQKEPNWFFRHLFDRVLKIGKPGFKFIFEIILGACVIFLAASFRNFENKMGMDQEQIDFVANVIKDDIEEFVYHNASGLEASKMKENRNKNTSNEVENESKNEVVNEVINGK